MVALEPTGKRSSRGVVWKCQCDCGNFSLVRVTKLTSGDAKSCGCSRTGDRKARNITGQRFGRLTVMKRTSKKKAACYVWRCRCDCGNIVFATLGPLNSGHKKSCGCLLLAYNFARHTNINPMDVPFEITNVMKVRRDIKKAIKQAS